ncbi:MAG: phage tail protein [Clostridia bacterium]|nr:phage tail protein [Clostridia bacterium]
MIKVYDQAGTMLAALEYADAVGYNLPHNDLWTATFRLPKDDPKNAYCQMHNLVSIDDGPRNLGMYRIIGSPDADMTTPGSYIVYNCEHVVATLLDDVLFGYHEVGGVSMDTAAVIRYILAQQDTARWQLGTCDFNQNFSYKFENDTLLGAIMSLGNVLTEPYTWDFDTDTTPWTINLRKADTAASCGIYYKRNLQQITKAVDASTLVTRLYLLGYGEGVNQLTIRDINGGKPYIDADTISVYGVKKSVFVDRRFEDPTALKARGEALLEGLKIPYTTYTAKAADLAQLTGDAWDTFMPGKIVHVLDGEDGIQFEARIVNVSKPDVHGRRGDVDIIIANSPRDIADSINTLADRQGINDLYSQGATNLYAQQFADNADADHPAVMRVFVPTGCVRINQMLVSYTAVNFRAYEKGAAAGGGSERTSSAGGSQVVTTSVMTLASATACSTPVTSDGSVTAMTSANEDQTTGTSSLLATDSSSGALVTGEGGEHTHTGPSHRHTGPSHTHAFSGSDSVANGHTHSIPSPGTSTNTGGVSTNVTHDVSISGNTDSAGTGNTGYGGTGNTGSAGKHNHSMAPHTHGMTHTHSVAGHSHKFSHVHLIQAAIEIPEQSVNIPSHSHSVTIDPHTHAMEYGIFEGGKAGSITVKVDGVAVDGVSETSATELDIAAYLEKDDEGKIRRGCWHTVELVPDTLTRIEANLFVQAFVQSVGGGDY